MPLLLKAPLVLLVIISFIASIYLAVTNKFGIDISFATPIALGIIVLLYIIAMIIERKNKSF